MDRIPAIRRVILADNSPVRSAVVTALAVLVPTALGLLIDQGVLGVPFVTYFPAVMMAALLIGWRWSVAVVGLCAVAANWAFQDERFAFSLAPADLLRDALFVLSCVVLVWTAEMARRLVRQLEAAQQHETLLNYELMHRVKNLLATVNAMAVLTARHSEPGQFGNAFTGRMRALDRVTDMLGVGKDAQCVVHKLVDGAIEPFRTSQFTVTGPDCELPRDACMPLGLALHELCTNAVKHGALSSPEGQVSLTWRCNPAGLLTLDWRETGGPPVPAERKPGMGTQLLRRQRGLKRVEVEFPPEGVTCRIEIDGVTMLAKAA